MHYACKRQKWNGKKKKIINFMIIFKFDQDNRNGGFDFTSKELHNEYNRIMILLT